MPARDNEIETQLKKSGQVTLDATGSGTLTFSTDSANQRWEIEEVVVKTNQSATATLVPFITLALNSTDITTLSDGNNRGQSWNGNQETFTGTEHVGPCDFFSVIFSPPTGTNGSAMAGVVASAVLTGSKFTRRG
jgi:hypothetical protein